MGKTAALVLERFAPALVAGDVIDVQVRALGSGLWVLLTHGRGEGDAAVHRAAWDALAAAADPPPQPFPGDLEAAGVSVCELTLEERPTESLIAFAGVGTATGAFNLPLYRAFADPFNTPGLVLSTALSQGASFEVHDSLEHRKAVFNTPEELYDLLAYIGSPGRFAVKRVIQRSSGAVAAVASTDRIAAVAGMAGHQHPLAIVRCDGDLPTVGEALEPFAIPALVEGFTRGSHLGPWMPVSKRDAAPGRFDGPPRAVALGFELSGGKLGEARDLFADPSFDRAREEANRLADVLRRHGPFEPHRLPLDEEEQAELPAATARTESRWADA
ncbi:MAG: fructose 1,6-bisphosphatase [Chloroflexi bacterium]|nr:fructose 1,6-bisphosphatase [Chloroflexota bacterium]